MEDMISEAPHVAIFPCPGISHLIPHAELAKQLALRHGFSATLFTISGSGLPTKGQEDLLKSLPAGVDYVALPPVNLHADSHILIRITSAILQSLPLLRAALLDLMQCKRIVAFVADPFCATSFDIAKDVGLTPYIFYTTNLLHLSLYFRLSEAEGFIDDLPDPLQMPGCIPLSHGDLPDSLRQRNPQIFGQLKENMMRLCEAEAILVNSFHELEPETSTYLRGKDSGKPPVYAIGPLLNAEGSKPDESSERCLRWLEQQPEGSVVYISFGSLGAMKQEQINEMALGLEQSGQRFLWVVRCPLDKVGEEDDPLHYLPEGFVERTKDRGFLLIAWAPQVQILSLPATVGFLTHCGWNSTLESIFNGVAMIAWPMYAEQKMNASMLEKGAKIALRVKVADDSSSVVRKEEISRVVKELMEGEQGWAARQNVKKLQEAAGLELTEEGRSFKALGEVATRWKELIRAKLDQIPEEYIG